MDSKSKTHVIVIFICFLIYSLLKVKSTSPITEAKLDAWMVYTKLHSCKKFIKF